MTDAQAAGPDLARLQSVLVLAMLMSELREESEILYLAATLIASFGAARFVGALLQDSGWQTLRDAATGHQERSDIETQIATLTEAGGAISIRREGWGWAFPLRAAEIQVGFLVVAANSEPSQDEQFLLRLLTQQAGIALSSARSHAVARATLDGLHAANAALVESVGTLQRIAAIHSRLARVAFEGGGQQGIANALHELTGYPVTVEGEHGKIRAWAGPHRPGSPLEEPPAPREGPLQSTELGCTPLREGGRLLAIAGSGDGRSVLVLHDEGAAGTHDRIALEYGAALLAMELTHERTAAEDEWRLRRDLVDELLHGVDADRAAHRAEALGYDLQRAHCVIVVAYAAGTPADDSLFHAVRRAARDTGIGTLVVARSMMIVIVAIAESRPPDQWEGFEAAVQVEIRGTPCRIGVGGVCARVDKLPGSFRQAQLALRVREAANADSWTMPFEKLGAYRLFADLTHFELLEEFVQQWLGPLLEYDTQKKGSSLVFTLDRYLAAGGNYNDTAEAIGTHRNTLKYRLQRIREISRLDLGDPDTLFNLQLATRAWSTMDALRDV